MFVLVVGEKDRADDSASNIIEMDQQMMMMYPKDSTTNSTNNSTKIIKRKLLDFLLTFQLSDEAKERISRASYHFIHEATTSTTTTIQSMIQLILIYERNVKSRNDLNNQVPAKLLRSSKDSIRQRRHSLIIILIMEIMKVIEIIVQWFISIISNTNNDRRFVGFLPSRCFTCGGIGHYANTCPNKRFYITTSMNQQSSRPTRYSTRFKRSTKLNILNELYNDENILNNLDNEG
ncbi:hypothetical protein Glove_384g23 [Diversispora epigaea]|uniref:CCHC-type domain-containing protein n=1 Tax=Diversispora epigaea TaxID=1348612 RepID=A0A397H4W1_9GLOM|nr:hypothetical protein Glove_384g23 [Diversispora epigaea]